MIVSQLIHGRQISYNIELILDLIDYKDYMPNKSFVLFIDILKAFDTVKPTFLLHLLESFRFWSIFLKNNTNFIQ